MGFKFIPCIHTYNFHIFKNLLINFDLMIHDLNKKFIFIKKRIIDSDQENFDSED